MVDPLSIRVPTEEELRAEEREDEWYNGPITVLGSCDLCGEVGIDKPATCERTIGFNWVSVCDPHAYRIDSASRARG